MELGNLKKTLFELIYTYLFLYILKNG